MCKSILQRSFGNKWNGRGGPIPWPARGSDLNSLDFSFWGLMKNEVYVNH